MKTLQEKKVRTVQFLGAYESRVLMSSPETEHTLLRSSPAAPLTWEVPGPPGCGFRRRAADSSRMPRAEPAAHGSFHVSARPWKVSLAQILHYVSPEISEGKSSFAEALSRFWEYVAYSGPTHKKCPLTVPNPAHLLPVPFTFPRVPAMACSENCKYPMPTGRQTP